MHAKIRTCFLCCEQKPLTEEHIIPQALGGKLAARIYCKDCNDTLGREVDSHLIKNIGFFSTALGIERERGENQPYDVCMIKGGAEFTFDGRKLTRKRPIVNIEKEGDQIKSIDITARSENELDEMIAGIQKKYKLAGDVKRIFEDHSGPTDTRMEFVFDNSLIRRAVAKISYGLICVKLPFSYVLSPSFDAIRQYILSGSGRHLATANFVHTCFMTDNTRPLHKIHISLNRRDNLIAAFVCLFGTFRYTVLLSDNFISYFEWPGLDYTFDPVISKEVLGNPRFKTPDLSVNDLLSPKHSKELVLSELTKGYKVLEKYIEGYEFLKMELDH